MGAYDAGYYGYLYSKVYAADMFYSIFKQNLMDGQQGRRYRHAVLEYGGGKDEHVANGMFVSESSPCVQPALGPMVQRRTSRLAVHASEPSKSTAVPYAGFLCREVMSCVGSIP